MQYSTLNGGVVEKKRQCLLFLNFVEFFYKKIYSFGEGSTQHYVCVFIPSPVREASTFLVIAAVQFFSIELKPVSRDSADANLKRFQHKVL